MIILGLDTSSSLCSVGLAESREEEVAFIGQNFLNIPHAHSEKILILLDDLLKQKNVDRKKIGAIAVSLGPGSFTGLRIGLSVAKGLSFALDVPVVGIPTLDVLAEKAKSDDKTVHVATGSRKNEFYYSWYEHGVRKSEYAILTTAEVILRLDARSVLVTDSPEIFSGQISKFCRIMGKESGFPDVSCLIKMANQRILRNEFDAIDSLVPLYVQSFKGIMG